MDIDGGKSLDTLDSVSTGDSVRGSQNVEDGGVSSDSEPGEELDVGASHFEQEESKSKDRRRAKSLPVYADQNVIYGTVFPETARKRVQFADTLGLSLASVKHFSATDDPKVPSIVVSRLQSFPPQLDRGSLDDLSSVFTSTLRMNRLVPAFKMPVHSEDFGSRVLRLRVALEKVTVSHFDIRGQIRAVTSGCSRKEVGVRYTFNDWLSFVDVQAIPMPGDDDAVQGEQFSFTLYTPPYSDASASVHFAVYFRTDHGEFWDNNERNNYTLWQETGISNETEAFYGT
ncbi:protein phosphatase 1 regulatory subunit 3G-like [Anguilla anguilla]|uniref:protein phosphatase 1 regulatory subunit 3G-like n=1 Tax=Anguilla anguilla TaxID=7936 RepID=UPI0015ABC9A6|nr:protein phosphatase 1 regulatory subunit 3G-like [Anguilla anguilla]